MNRRDLITLGAGPARAGASGLARAAAPGTAGRMLSAADFGAIGDGDADDTEALRTALDATFDHEDPGFLPIPPRIAVPEEGAARRITGAHASMAVGHAHVMAALTLMPITCFGATCALGGSIAPIREVCTLRDAFSNGPKA